MPSSIGKNTSDAITDRLILHYGNEGDENNLFEISFLVFQLKK